MKTQGGDTGLSSQSTPVEKILKWFSYDDPIAISEDPECDYGELLGSLIKRETAKTKDKMSVRASLDFIQRRVATEFCDDVLRQPD